jgi:hypothetical protein
MQASSLCETGDQCCGSVELRQTHQAQPVSPGVSSPDIDGLALYDLLQETRGLASTPAIIFGVSLPTQALAVIETQRLVLLSTPIDLEGLGRARAQLGISFAMN